MVVTIGIDVHKNTHCAVAIDEAGRQMGQPLTVRATDAGHRQLLRWSRREFPEATVEFAVEDCRHVSARLEQGLLAAEAVVVRVPPKLMAQTRSSARTRGKSDPIDALAIARAALREPTLPRAEHTHVSRELKLLVDRREDLVEARTKAQNRLRWHLHELDPELDVPARGLDLAKHQDRVQARLEELPASLVRRLALEILGDIRDLTGRINLLEKEIAAVVRVQAPLLLTLPGCGPLTAAKLVGETANPARFRSEACFAMHAGAAPIPASSGKTNRHRLARGGNRQLNAALHRIAVTQIRLDGLGRAYYQRRRSEGDTTMEALRALKRRLARIVFNLLRPTDQTAAASLPQAA
ncbi:IS110 family transposase [Blastococcus jejuensis]|uniref:IS110 family transposase n=1 Tax=Blastococcus jejuensis TaxID=351224 RepID=A0ABP6PVZ8_9ACTN